MNKDDYCMSRAHHMDSPRDHHRDTKGPRMDNPKDHHRNTTKDPHMDNPKDHHRGTNKGPHMDPHKADKVPQECHLKGRNMRSHMVILKGAPLAGLPHMDKNQCMVCPQEDPQGMVPLHEGPLVWISPKDIQALVVLVVCLGHACLVGPACSALCYLANLNHVCLEINHVRQDQNQNHPEIKDHHL